MTIDEAIKGVEKRILPIYDNDADHKALEMAIDTMHKYQKIQEIIKDWEDGRFSDAVGCLRVKAVLDGNDD